jgi:hypothetical protein
MRRLLLRLMAIYLGLVIFGIAIVYALLAREPEPGTYAARSVLSFAVALVGATAGLVVSLVAAGGKPRFRISDVLLAMVLLAAAFAIVSLVDHWLTSAA